MNLKRAPLCELGLGQEREEASVEGLQENRTKEGTSYAVGVHMDLGAGERRDQRASVGHRRS